MRRGLQAVWVVAVAVRMYSEAANAENNDAENDPVDIFLEHGSSPLFDECDTCITRLSESKVNARLISWHDEHHVLGRGVSTFPSCRSVSYPYQAQ